MRVRRPIPGMLLVASLLLGLGCDDDHGRGGDAGADAVADTGSSCALGFLGDPALPVELTIVVRGNDGVSRQVTEGDEVPMIRPPQGGQVIFAGARATNLDACEVELSGSLRDPTQDQVRVDARTVNLVPTGDGWGAPVDAVIATFSNIPTCPNQWAATDLYDQPFALTISLTDRGGRTASRTIMVTPVCGQPMHEAECECECKEGYTLGEDCSQMTP